MNELSPLRNPFKGGKKVGANIDSRAYHAQMDGVRRGDPRFVMNRSELMLFLSSPRRWIRGYSPSDTEATDFGSLIDCLVTDKARLLDRFAYQPAEQSATKTMQCVKNGEASVGDMVPWSPQSSEAKAWKKEQEGAGKIIVNASEQKDSEDAVKGLFEDKKVSDFIGCCEFQVMCVSEYHDHKTGLVVPVKCLIDFLPALDTEFQNDMGDLKTARNGDPEKWRNVCEERTYDVQAAMNLWVYHAATGEERTGFRHVILENKFPFEVGRRLMETPMVVVGQMKLMSALELYAQCLKSNTWPSWDDLPVAGLQNYGGWTGIAPKEWTLVKYLGQGARV